jgi:hypothetical protein
VTIDDLRALYELLQTPQFSGDGSTNSAPVMEFQGGMFDDPGDLEQLTDEELKQISIKTARVEVTLSVASASVIGTEDLTESVKSSWARVRQTKRKPKLNQRKRWLRRIGVFVAALILIGVTAYLGGAAIVGIFGAGELSAAHVSTFIVLWIAGVTWAMVDDEPKEYAIILPVTLAQSRADGQIRQRHLQTAIVALCGVVVALVGVIVTVLVAK